MSGIITRDPGSGSLIKIEGKIDFSAPRLQILTSPVSGAPITLPSVPEGSIFPRRWDKITVLERYEPVMLWEDTLKRNPEAANLSKVDEQDTLPLPSVGETFIIKQTEKIKKAYTTIEDKAKYIAIYILIALILIERITRR